MTFDYPDLRPPGDTPAGLLLEPEKVAALREGAKRGATVVPASLPTPVLRYRTVSDLANLIRGHLPINVVGPDGIGTSTVAIAAARMATKRNKRIIYLDLSRIRRSDEVARKILLAAGGSLAATERPTSSLRRLSATNTFEDCLLLLDNCADSRLLLDIDLDLLPCIVVTHTAVRGFTRSIAIFQVEPLSPSESEALDTSLIHSELLPEHYAQPLSRWLAEWPAGIRFVRTALSRGLIEEIAPVLNASRHPAEVVSVLAARIWRILSDDASKVLYAILTAGWLQVNTSNVRVLAEVSSAKAKTALDELFSLGVLVKASRAYRLQPSMRLALSKSKSAPRHWRQDTLERAVSYATSRLQRIQREIRSISGQIDEFDLLYPTADEPSRWTRDYAVRRSYTTLSSDVAWLEREWASLEQLLENVAGGRRAVDITRLLVYLRTCLEALGRSSSLPWLQELEYRTSQTYGGVREQREALRNLARALEGEGRLSDAIGAESQAVALSRRAAARRDLGFDLLDLARLKAKARDIVDATSSLEEAVAIFRAAQIADGEARALLSLGELYEAAGKGDDALPVYSRAIRLLDGPSNSRDRGAAFLKLGAIHESAGRWEQARGAYMSAVNAIEGEHDSALEALSQEQLGRVFAKEGRPEDAILALRRALEIYHKLRDRRREIDTLLALGNVESIVGDSDLARTYYESALNMADEAGDLLSRGRAQSGLAETYIRSGNWPEALSWLEQAYLNASHLGLRREEGPILQRLADIYEQQADISKAIESLRSALELYEDIGDSSGSAAVAKQLGKYYHVLGDERVAASYLEQGAAHARQIGDKETEAEVLQMLRESYTKLGLPVEVAAVGRRIDYLTQLNSSTGSDSHAADTDFRDG